MWKAAPALAFGNVVVLKPAEASAHTATLLAESALAAGIPAGVFNVVLGVGADIGRSLLDAPDVWMTPWHACVLQHRDGRRELIRRADAERPTGCNSAMGRAIVRCSIRLSLP